MPYKLLFMGSPEFAVPALQALLDSKHEVLAVYSQPPRPAGRGQKEQKTPVHQLAEQHGIRVHTPASLKSPEEQEIFAGYHADVAVVAAYGLLLPPPILAGCRLGCINIHPSLLPRWRGAAPLQRSIMAGDKQTGVCIMQMEAGLDTGPVLSRTTMPLPDRLTAGDLHDMLAAEGATLLLNTLDALEKQQVSPQPQPESGATYAKKIDKDEAHIDWNRPAHEVLHHIHGLSPFPGAWCEHQGTRLKMLRVRVAESRVESRESSIDAHPPSPTQYNLQTTGAASPLPSPCRCGASLRDDGRVKEGVSPGTVLSTAPLIIACADGALEIRQLQKAGSKAMSAEELLRGYTICMGGVLS